MVLFLLSLSSFALAAPGTDDAERLLQQALDSACQEPSPSSDEMAARIAGSAAIHDESLTMRGTVVGWQRHFELPDGAEIRMRRLAPDGRLRRLEAEYWSVDPDNGIRPRLAALTGPGCGIQPAAGIRRGFTADHRRRAPGRLARIDGRA